MQAGAPLLHDKSMTGLAGWRTLTCGNVFMNMSMYSWGGMARCLCTAVIYKVIGHPLIMLQLGASETAALHGLVSAEALTLGYRRCQDILFCRVGLRMLGFATRGQA